MATLATEPDPVTETGRTVAAGDTLVAHFRRQVRTRPDAPAMYFRAGSRWAPITWRQFGEAARRLSALLVAEGVAEGGHVAIWASNRPEWHIADAAILSARARPVPVYLTLSADQCAYVLGHSEAEVAVVENRALLDRILSVRDRLPRLRRVVVLEGVDATEADDLVVPWLEALERGGAALLEHGAEVERRAAAIEPADVATLIYTSGTTGPPKAVKLTHRNVLAGAAGLATFIDATAEDRILSYLPLAHIAERGSSEFRQYLFGNPVWFSRGIAHLADDLREVRPTLFFGVPRVWEKMAAAIQARLAAARGPRAWLGRWALRTGAAAAARRERGEPVEGLLARRHAVAERLVLQRLRAALGLDAARLVASGAAPISPEVLRFFAAIGIDVLEVYGMTEDTGLTTMNRPGRMRIGTVGTLIPGIEARIAGDGEILVRGEVVFAGYHRDDEATAATVVDGWLHTGDIGELDADGYLRITDRKKDLIITAGGKNIAPGPIESALKHHPLVSNAVVIGDRRPFVSALLTLDPAEAAAFAAPRGLPADAAVLARDPQVLEAVQRQVDAVNAGLSGVEQVRRWRLLDRDFAVGEELTPTLKVRRAVVAERWAAEIESNYAATT